MPLCASHGSFSPANLLMRDGDLAGVVQWGEYRAEDHPFTDLWHLLVSTAVKIQGTRAEPQTYLTRHLLGRGWYRDVADDACRRLSEIHRVPLHVTRTFLVIHLVRLIRRNRRHLPGTTGRLAVWVGLLKQILMFESTGEGFLR